MDLMKLVYYFQFRLAEPTLIWVRLWEFKGIVVKVLRPQKEEVSKFILNHLLH